MARPLRIEFPGAVYHVIARGLEKRNIFAGDEDKAALRTLFSKLFTRYNFIFYAYCIMDNHYHLLLETPDGNLSRGMQSLNGTYAQVFNEKYERCGHLFQGRYKAYLVEKESYLLTVSRYIVLNPVRAMITNHPSSYAWSSYSETAGGKKPPDFLVAELILSQFSKNGVTARREYRDFINQGINNEPHCDFDGAAILGGEDFNEKIKDYIKEKKEIKEIPRKERFQNRPSLAEIFAGAEDKFVTQIRDEKILIAFMEHGYTQKEIGAYLGLHYSTISVIIKRWEEG
jgi:REP element-mobilizing transposase RayT